MFNTLHPSLEEMPMAFEGHVQLPVICNYCYHALRPERHAGSRPKSYIALATGPYHYTVIDWNGCNTRTCHCCNDRAFGERHSVEVHRKG